MTLRRRRSPARRGGEWPLRGSPCDESATGNPLCHNFVTKRGFGGIFATLNPWRSSARDPCDGPSAMGCRSDHLSSGHVTTPSWRSSVSRRHRITALLALFSMALQPFTLSAPPQVPLSRFAPAKPAPPNPFVWFPPGPPRPSSPRRHLSGPSRPAILPQPGPAAPQAWQPAAIDENAPIAPPDGVPIAPGDRFPGPMPGIVNAAGNYVVAGKVSDATSLTPVAGAYIDVVGTGRTPKPMPRAASPSAACPQAPSRSRPPISATSPILRHRHPRRPPAEARFGLRLKPSTTPRRNRVEEETIVGEYQGDAQGDFNLSLDGASVTSVISKEDLPETSVMMPRARSAKSRSRRCQSQHFAVVRGLRAATSPPVQQSCHLIGESVRGRTTEFSRPPPSRASR